MTPGIRRPWPPRRGPAVRWRAVVFGILAGVGGALAVAAPAAAHSADAPTATDYRTTITGITQAVPGLTIRTVEAGARLELVNRSARTIEVLGYSGEPYLRVGPDGVWQNANSPAAYLNETLTGGVAPPSSAGPAQTPDWQRLSRTPAVLWHDQRTHWTESRPPADVQGEPGAAHHIRDWSVPLRDGVRQFALRGSLDWVPPPFPAAWWAGGLLLAAGVTVAASRWRWAGLVALTGGLAAAAYAVGGALDAGALGPAGVLRLALSQQTWPLVCGLGAVAAGGYALGRRPAAELALGLAGLCLALFAGLGNAAVFAHGVVPLPYPPTLARGLVLAALAGGAGLALAAVVRLRRGSGQARAASGQAEICPDTGVVSRSGSNAAGRRPGPPQAGQGL